MYKIYQLCGKNDYMIKFGINISLNEVEDILKKYNYVTEQKDNEFLKMIKNDTQCYIYDYGDIIFFNIKDDNIEDIAKDIDSAINKK